MITVRPTAGGDLSALAALFERSFGHPLDADEWTWKYRLLPGEARSLVAIDGAGCVLAHAGALRFAARWRGGEGAIWQLVDFAGRPGGRGLRPALVELGRQLLADLPGEADAPWVFGFPSERHFRLGEHVFGYRPLTALPQLAGPLPQPPPDAAAAPRAAAGLWSGDSCGEWAEAIWERCAVLGVRRSAAFLNWRYWARPRRYYRFYRLLQGGEEGLAVFAFIGETAWATELWLPPAGEWYSAMLAVAADLWAAGLRAWRFWPPPPGPAADLPAAAPGAGSCHAGGAGAAGAAHAAPAAHAAHAADTAGLLRRLEVHPDGEPRFVGCRGNSSAGVDPVTAAGGFYYAMGDYDLA
jgi:hypothetical protein